MLRHVRFFASSAAAVAVLLWAGTAFAQGQQLSPRASAEAEIGGATVQVDYGQPSKRGRAIFGQLVPWGRVWRTGANEATGFTTDKDLVVGGADVPAGSYTLYTLPAETGAWKLIINRQTGQWGTQYDEAQDLARVDLKTATLSEPLEKFTIEVKPEGDGGVLRLAWDTTEATVPFAVKE